MKPDKAVEVEDREFTFGRRSESRRRYVAEVHTGAHLQMQARVALDIAKSMALVAADLDGEDSSGRQKLRLLSPAEAAERAVALSEQLFARFEARGWVLEIPDQRIIDEPKAKEESA